MKIFETRFPHIRFQKTIMKIITSQSRRIVHSFFCGFARAVFRRHFFGRKIDMRRIGQLFHRFGKCQIFHFLQKGENSPAGMAAETIKEAAIGRHGKRRRTFMMKRAASPIPVSLFLQRNVRRNHIHDIDTVPHAFNQIRRYPHTKPLITLRNH